MKTLAHPVAPEDVMALIDRELTASESEEVTQHIAQCAECAALRDQLLDTSKLLAEWTVPQVPETVDKAIDNAVSARVPKNKRTRANDGFTLRDWRMWAVAGGGVIFGVLALVVLGVSISYYGQHSVAKQAMMVESIGSESGIPQSSPRASAAKSPREQEADAFLSPARTRTQPEMMNGQLSVPAAPPLIARTASLTIVVKNLDVSRTGLESILSRHRGYAAELSDSEQTQPRGLTSSLRIPVDELEAATAEIRALGNVDRETQSGEEVTQQHADLAARLANARETESRLRDILEHRTGKMEDVLEVEEKISETRGEIERLEAERQTLEHRVEFASVDLQLIEQYEARLGNPSTSISNRMHNSFVAGLRHAGSSLLSLLLFVEEYGPVLLVWLMFLGTPAVLFWRRYRRARNSTGL